MNNRSEGPQWENAVCKYEEGSDLLSAGHRARGLALLREAAEAGVAPAYGDLAEEAHRRGDKDEVRRCMKAIEDLAQRNMPAAHVTAHFAYLNGLGEQERDDRTRIAWDYLKRGAESGDPASQTMLAANYQTGANGFPEDSSKYEFWIQKAVEAEDECAIVSFTEYLLEHRRALPPELREKLARAAANYVPAAIVLDRVRKMDARQRTRRTTR
ncbi:MAG TPA: hypothetical protein VFB45_10245 [Pseudolabrys sp.]|nr:hypothetical protein [Pseudolabrys sp.]